MRTSGADAAVDGNWSGSATYPGYAGQTVIGVYAWIPQLKVALMAEQGEGEALQATRLALWTTGAVALLAALLAILIGTALIHGIVRPLSELGDTAGRIADGELDLSARVKRDDEIGRLATAFNRMTGRLHELAASKERQRLARDLHDAVSQTLFSISLMAEVLPRIYEKDHEAGQAAAGGAAAAHARGARGDAHAAARAAARRARRDESAGPAPAARRGGRGTRQDPRGRPDRRRR